MFSKFTRVVYRMYQCFISYHCGIIFHCMDVPDFIYPPLLRMRTLRFRDVTQCAQGCAGSKGRGGDHNPDLLAPRTRPGGEWGGANCGFRWPMDISALFPLVASLQREAQRRRREVDQCVRRGQSPLPEASGAWVKVLSPFRCQGCSRGRLGNETQQCEADLPVLGQLAGPQSARSRTSNERHQADIETRPHDRTGPSC